MRYMLLVVLGLIAAVFGLAQGLMVRHPSAPVFLLVGVAGLALVIYGAVRMSKSGPPAK